MQWIKCEDRLPQNRTLVLVCVVQTHLDYRIWRGIITAYFDYEQGWICPFSPKEKLTVKCWKDCPELPEYLKNEDE